ncbi:hypothetical protein B0H15DRAFT_952552 [Mycena belliarum]|uniref:Uncharacterized protein n=1 Tax=Mycena belliarum TaxID=1033014 RepID=A0AAD6U2G0_9AGAR|nr:hypothetical protein B0H15DRAFT_952552 [Mycena belliae]
MAPPRVLTGASLDSLPATIKRKAQKALRGGMGALDNLQLVSIPDALTRRNAMLAVIYANLDSSRVPTSVTMEEFSRTQADGVLQPVKAFWWALTRLGELLAEGEVPGPTRTHLWTRVIPWVVFLDAFAGALPEGYSVDSDDNATLIACVVYSFHSFDETVAPLQETEILYVFLSRIWMAEVGRQGSSLERTFRILDILARKEKTDPTQLDRLDCDRNELTFMLRRQIASELTRPMDSRALLAVEASLKLMLSCVHYSGLASDRRFWDEGLVETVVAAVSALEAERRVMPVAEGPAFLGLLVLLRMFDRGEGTPVLASAVRAGLVKVVMRLSEAKQPPNPLMPAAKPGDVWGTWYVLEDAERVIEGLLRDTLTPSICSFSVARHFGRALAEALEEASTSEVRPSGEWEWFADFARRRMVVVRAFLEGERQPEACENVKGAVEMRGMRGQGLLQSEVRGGGLEGWAQERVPWNDRSWRQLLAKPAFAWAVRVKQLLFIRGCPRTAFVTILDLDKSSESVEAAGVWQLGPGARLSADERCHGWRALWRLAACIDDVRIYGLKSRGRIFTAMWCKKSETERALDNAEGEEWEFWAAKYLKQEKEELRKWGF